MWAQTNQEHCPDHSIQSSPLLSLIWFLLLYQDAASSAFHTDENHQDTHAQKYPHFPTLSNPFTLRTSRHHPPTYKPYHRFVLTPPAETAHSPRGLQSLLPRWIVRPACPTTGVFLVAFLSIIQRSCSSFNKWKYFRNLPLAKDFGSAFYRPRSSSSRQWSQKDTDAIIK